MNEAIKILNDETFSQAFQTLSKRDPDLAHLLETLGTPPQWFREPGFATLLYIILEQQVSLQSAKAVYARLNGLITPLTPDRFLKLDDATLKGIGFSRQKIAYGRNLAQTIVDDTLDLDSLSALDDAAVSAALTAIKGIGPWTANIYLLMALRRPDIWPIGDLALAIAVQEVKKLEKRPTHPELTKMAEAWRPWRSVAAHLFWHYYLNR